MQYLPDPVGVEAIGTPTFHLRGVEEQGGTAGDCDDGAALIGALARSVGRPVRLHVASFRPDGRLHHIWAEAQGAGAWLALDPFREERFNGRETRGYLVRV